MSKGLNPRIDERIIILRLIMESRCNIMLRNPTVEERELFEICYDIYKSCDRYCRLFNLKV